LAEFRIVVTVDPTRAVRGGRRVEQQLNRTQTAADRLGASMRRAFALTGLTIGVSAVVRVLASYEQSMSTVKAITRATESEFASLRAETQRLGATTRFSASQAADGAAFLARAGFSTEQVLGSLNQTLLLAQAGNLGLASAADIASNVLQGFRLPVSDAGRVVDVLAFAANNANTDVQQLGDAMKFVAPVAAGLGVSVEETAAAIGVLSDAGLQASMAGTGLRRVMSELESPATKTRKILEALGVSQDEYWVSSVGLSAALQALKDAGVTTGQALELFGDRGGPAFEVLSAGLGDVNSLTVAMRDAGGTAAEMAAVMDDNLMGSLLAVKSAAEALVIALGDAGVTDALRSALDALAAVLRFLADNAEAVTFAVQLMLTAFVAGKVLKFATAISTAVKALIALQFALGATTTASAVTAGALKTLGVVGGAALRTLLGPIGLVVSAVGVLIATIRTVRNEMARLEQSGAQSVSIIQTRVRTAADLAAVQSAITDEEATIKDLEENGGNIIRDISGITAREIVLRREALAVAKESLDARRAAIESGANLDLPLSGNLLPPEVTAVAPEGNPLAGLDTGSGGAKAAEEVNEVLERRKALLESITGAQVELNLRSEDLALLYESGAISVQQFTEAMRDLNAEVSALDNSFAGGLANGFDRIKQRANELGSTVSNAVVGAFDGLTDAIVNFAKTGELNIKAVFASLAAEMLKIATNQLFAQLLGGLGGGLGGGGGGGFGGLGKLLGFQNGGSGMVTGAGGTDSSLVAFRATPGERVDISTPGQQRNSGRGQEPTIVQAPAPNVMVNISPRDITNALAGSEGDDFIIQGLERNARSARAILGA
jgi:TP901 family phage tail tape measure protein